MVDDYKKFPNYNQFVETYFIGSQYFYQNIDQTDQYDDVFGEPTALDPQTEVDIQEQVVPEEELIQQDTGFEDPINFPIDQALPPPGGNPYNGSGGI